MEVDEQEKTLDEVTKKMDEEAKKEKEGREFRYDKTISLPADRDPLHFDQQYKEMIKTWIMNRFDFG